MGSSIRASKKPTPANFTIDQDQANILLSNIEVGLFADNNTGVISWSLSADQYNKTELNDNPSNGTLYLYLLDSGGAVIPSASGKNIAMFPSHVHCREQGTQVWQGKAYGYPTGGDLLATIKNVSLGCEKITYDVGTC